MKGGLTRRQLEAGESGPEHGGAAIGQGSGRTPRHTRRRPELRIPEPHSRLGVRARKAHRGCTRPKYRPISPVVRSSTELGSGTETLLPVKG